MSQRTYQQKKYQAPPQGSQQIANTLIQLQFQYSRGKDNLIKELDAPTQDLVQQVFDILYCQIKDLPRGSSLMVVNPQICNSSSPYFSQYLWLQKFFQLIDFRGFTKKDLIKPQKARFHKQVSELMNFMASYELVIQQTKQQFDKSNQIEEQIIQAKEELQQYKVESREMEVAEMRKENEIMDESEKQKIHKIRNDLNLQSHTHNQKNEVQQEVNDLEAQRLKVLSDIQQMKDEHKKLKSKIVNMSSDEVQEQLKEYKRSKENEKLRLDERLEKVELFQRQHGSLTVNLEHFKDQSIHIARLNDVIYQRISTNEQKLKVKSDSNDIKVNIQNLDDEVKEKKEMIDKLKALNETEYEGLSEPLFQKLKQSQSLIQNQKHKGRQKMDKRIYDLNVQIQESQSILNKQKSQAQIIEDEIQELVSCFTEEKKLLAQQYDEIVKDPIFSKQEIDNLRLKI